MSLNRELNLQKGRLNIKFVKNNYKNRLKVEF